MPAHILCGWARRDGRWRPASRTIVNTAASALTRLIERVGLKKNGIQISIKLPISSDERRDVATPNEPALSRFVPMRMKRRGVEMRLIIDGDAASLARVDLPLLDATARAYRWSNDLLAGREHLTARHVRRVMRLAFLAPRVVEAIVEGRQPADLSCAYRNPYPG
jgi:site-specific DNA recombinase